MRVSYMHETPSFDALWLAETLRLQELRGGALDDQSETAQARRLGGSFAQRLLARAMLLAQRDGLRQRLEHWQTFARLTFAALALLAIVTGASMALGALGDGVRAVNLMQAVALLLGLHWLTYLFWAITALTNTSRPAGLGAIWLWLTQRLTRSHQSALIGQALITTLQRSQALKPLLGMLTHAIWTLAFVAATVALLGLLSARQYVFQWETTLLQPDVFIVLTQGLGWLPSLAGFTVPPESVITQSIANTGTVQASAGPVWSQWLIGCVVVYGLLPRLLTFLVCLTLTRRRLKQHVPDTNLPGFAELRPRLMPDSQSTGIDAPAPTFSKHRSSGPKGPQIRAGGHNAMAGIELPGDMRWPPEALQPLATDLGRVDTRAQRQQLQHLLEARQFEHLIAVCDGRQTPDRGTLIYLRELAQVCQHLHILVLLPDPAPTNNRTTLWQQSLEHAGFEPTRIYIGLPAFTAHTGVTPSTTNGNP